MTDIQLQDALYDWINKVLNTDEGLNIDIIHGSQNAPRPSSSYIVIHQPINTRKIGRSDRSYSDTDGNTNIVSNYEASVTIEAVGLLTDYLRLILDSIEKQSIRDYLNTKNISFMRSENIIPISDMTENEWELRTSVDIFVLYPHETTENASYIGSVDWNNDIL